MKRANQLLLSFLLTGLLIPAANAQITDDDTSATMLAFQCAVSSGNSASGYEGYGRSLAKTLALMSAEQQERIFGYTPQPAGSFAKVPAGGSFGLASASFVNPGASVDVADQGAVMAAIGAFNEALFGVAEGPTAIIAGKSPAESAASVGQTDSNSTPVNLAAKAGDQGLAPAGALSEVAMVQVAASKAAEAGSQTEMAAVMVSSVEEDPSLVDGEEADASLDAQTELEKDAGKWWEGVLEWLGQKYEEIQDKYSDEG